MERTIEMKEIKNLHDLVQLGIKIHRKGVPEGFIVAVNLTASKRTVIFANILELTDIYPDHFRIENTTFDFYSFTILGIKFHVF